MRKILSIPILLILFTSACSTDLAEPAEEEESVERSEAESLSASSEPFKLNEIFLDQNSYEIKTESLLEDENAFIAYLYYGDTKIFELPWEGTWNSKEFLVAKVFEDERQDIVFLTSGRGCGGCVSFLEQYFTINKADLSVEEVDFASPIGFDLFEEGSPMYAIFADEVNEMAYVKTSGDPYNYNNEPYYEEVWTYHFTTQEWKLVETIKDGETVMCEGMGLSPDPKKISYWDEALLISPKPIEGGMSCN